MAFTALVVALSGTAYAAIKLPANSVGTKQIKRDEITGDKVKESGKAAEPQAKSSWSNLKDGATSFGSSVKHFFTTLFNK